MSKENGKRRKKSKAEKQEGILMTVIKSTWYTVVLIIFLFVGALIFMGIEGNHEDFKSYKLLEDRNIFVKNLTNVSGRNHQQIFSMLRVKNIERADDIVM